MADFDVVVINIHMEQFFATYNFKNLINNLRFKNIDNLSYEDMILKNHQKDFQIMETFETRSSDLCNLTFRVKQKVSKTKNWSHQTQTLRKL